jgi:hypothetical protein
MPPQLDGSRELAALLVGATDHLGYGFWDHEHDTNMRLSRAKRKNEPPHKPVIGIYLQLGPHTAAWIDSVI